MERANVYEIVTERMIEAITREGKLPWQQPWKTADRPRNVDGRPYHGLNTFYLMSVARANGYTDPRWLTFNQAKERGGNVRRGEHSTEVWFWKMVATRHENEDGDVETGRRPLLRYFRVFNVEQCESLRLAPLPVADHPTDPIAECEAIAAGYANGPAVATGTAAQYLIKSDVVEMPERDQFVSAEAWYATLFHELGHSTGHSTRLDREGISGFDRFGSERYGREELIAEMTSAFLCGEAGLEIAGKVQDNSASYLRSWIETIRADDHALLVAANRAERAADHILGRAAEESAAAAA